VPAATDEIVRLVENRDGQGLERMASALQLDPWLVADELCARGAFDAADAYVVAAPPTRRGGVAAFVAGQRRSPSDPARRAAMKAAYSARIAGHPAEGLRIIDSAGAARDDVVSVRLLHERALEVAALGDGGAAIDALLALVETVRRLDWPEREARLCEYVALQAEERRDFGLGARMWNRVAEIFRGFPADREEGRALQCLAKMRFVEGRPGDALSSMRRALPLVARGGEDTVLGCSYSALAVYEDEAGELASARAHHEEAIRLLARSSIAEERILAAMNASRNWYRLNDVAGAIALADRALADPALLQSPAASVSTSPASSLRAQVLLSRAEYRMKAGELDRALADVDEAARAFRAAGDQRRLVRALGQRGILQRMRGQPESARIAFDDALRFAETVGDRSLAGLVRLNLGALLEQQGAHDDAVKSWEAAIADAREAGSEIVESHCLERIAVFLLARGDAAEALVRSRAAVAAERRSARGLGADEAALLSAGDRASWQIGLDAAHALGDVGAWFEMCESGRASALAESVGGRAAIQATAIPDTLTAEAESATADLARAVDEAAKARASGELAASRAAAKAETAARERVRIVQDRIERKKKLAANLDAPTPPTLDEVRARLGKGRALALFHVGAETAEALVVTADGARLVALGDAKAFVATCDAAGVADAPEDAVAAAKAALVEKLGLAKDVRALLVVPDGPVATVPFALLDQDRDVAIVPSALVWTLLDAARGEPGAGVLAIGDPDYKGTRFTPLPASRAEAEAVGTRTITGKDATEDALRRALVESPRWRAVHFACHGVTDARHPSLSGLVLTRAGQDDGVFTAREILGLSVPAEVVLSACEAGRPGAQSAATGIPPAFLAAGALRVVANLWKVDDEAARVFSVAFHKTWSKDGATAARALRAARDAVRADPRFSAPRHWAGWVLWGLPD
jgi:tetratricopeptide (TPR) repeat protein